jgi:hypothetical protein
MGFWQAFGRGIIKLLVSLLAGFGVGLLVIGNAARGDPDFWRERPPGGLLEGIGAGLLTAAAMLLLLFFMPWWFRKSPGPQERREP